MKFYAVIAVAAMLSLSVLVVVSPASYAFKAYNVNLNRTIDLPIELAYPKTTIQPGYPSCGTDTFETIHNVFDNEKKQDPKMFKSDMMGILTLSENSSYSWCGIEGPQPQPQLV